MILPLRCLVPLWGLALVLPAPAVEARQLAVPLCSGGVQTLVLPVDGRPVPRDEHDCCRKACHAASERRRKANHPTDGCC